MVCPDTEAQINRLIQAQPSTFLEQLVEPSISKCLPRLSAAFVTISLPDGKQRYAGALGSGLPGAHQACRSLGLTARARNPSQSVQTVRHNLRVPGLKALAQRFLHQPLGPRQITS